MLTERSHSWRPHASLRRTVGSRSEQFVVKWDYLIIFLSAAPRSLGSHCNLFLCAIEIVKFVCQS